MNLYPLLRPLLFSLDPELTHDATLTLLKLTHQTGLSGLIARPPAGQPTTVMGLHFKNPLGLAAGLDKNGDYLDALADLGFGFIEIGTVTPKPQPGNCKPRLFRLPEHQAIINRMGFNNLGIDHLLAQVERSRYSGVLGINIGKNAATPIESAEQDYLQCLGKAYARADYVSINISSPNTRNLRQLQVGKDIVRLLQTLKEEQLKLQAIHKKYTPIALKIAPDLNDIELAELATLLVEFEIDAVIATNTTLDRHQVQGHIHAEESGGLSGAPLKNKATQTVKHLAEYLAGKVPIIAAGGICCAKDAQEKIQAGASLVQIFSGLIYQGPQLVTDILQRLQTR